MTVRQLTPKVVSTHLRAKTTDNKWDIFHKWLLLSRDQIHQIQLADGKWSRKEETEVTDDQTFGTYSKALVLWRQRRVMWRQTIREGTAPQIFDSEDDRLRPTKWLGAYAPNVSLTQIAMWQTIRSARRVKTNVELLVVTDCSAALSKFARLARSVTKNRAITRQPLSNSSSVNIDAAKSSQLVVVRTSSLSDRVSHFHPRFHLV